jgi:Zn ribbon nucleic-acid-binding protein
MSSYERLLASGSTELPECRCGKEMQLWRIEEIPGRTDAQIRIYNCPTCQHEMRLTVWSEDLPA